MNRNIKETIKKELRTIIRDRKSLIMMLLTPLLIPIFILIFSYTYNNIFYNQETKISYIGTNYSPNNIEKKIMKDNNIKVKEFKNKEEMKEAFDKNKIDAYITIENNKYKIYYNEINENSITASANLTSYLNSYNTYLANNYLNNINANLDLVYNNITYNDYYLWFYILYHVNNTNSNLLCNRYNSRRKRKRDIRNFSNFPNKKQ